MGYRTEAPQINGYGSSVVKSKEAPDKRVLFTHKNTSVLTTIDLSGNTQNLLSIGCWASSIDSTTQITVYDGDSTGTLIGEDIPINTLPNYQMDFGNGGLVISNDSVTVIPSGAMNITLKYVYDN